MPALLTLLRHTTEGWVISRRLCNIYRMVNVQQTNLFAQNRPNTRSLEREEERYECKESCVARYRHEHLSLNFTSQDWTIEAQRFDNYTVVIFSGTYKNRGETHLNTPVNSFSGTGSFGLIKSCLSVVWGWKETLTPSGVRTRRTASDTPRT